MTGVFKEAFDSYEKSLNQKFMTGMFKEAFDSYKKALDCVAIYDFYVAPLNAARVATNALILDSDHEKSRIRRAKAELELYRIDPGSLIYLVQAKHDLEEVLNSYDSSNIGRAKLQEPYWFKLKNCLIERGKDAKRNPAL
eukprot:scaffold9209_cov22-Cyclotella_meneghiniana.AAC.2